MRGAITIETDILIVMLFVMAMVMAMMIKKSGFDVMLLVMMAMVILVVVIREVWCEAQRRLRVTA